MKELFASRLMSRLVMPAMAMLFIAGCAGVPSEESGQIPETAQARVSAAKPSNPRALPPGVLYRLLSAEFAARRGNPQAAIATYMDVARETRDAGVAERATRMAVYARDEPAGRDAAKLWVELADNLEAYRVYAVLLVRAGQTEAALGALGTIVERFDNGNGDVFRVVAELLNRDRNKERRVVLMEQIAAEYPDSVPAQSALAQVAARAGQAEKASAILKGLYEADPANDTHAAFYASLLRNQGKMKEALALLKGQVERRPDGREMRMLYARFLVDAKRYEDAQAQFQHLAKAFPERSDIRYALGLLLLQTNHHDAARPHFEALVKLGEQTLQANFYLGRIAEAQEKPEEAIGFYRRVDRGEHYLNAQIRVAAIYADIGKLNRARQHLSVVRRDNAGDDIRLYRAEAELLARSDDIDGAIGVYDVALKTHPKNTDLLYARAMLAARVERFEILERDLRDILTREPNNADALNALGYTLADRDDRVEEAYDLIKRALALKPEDHYIIDSMGWVLYRLGRLEDAVTYLKKALSIKADAEVAAHLGEVLWVLGRKDEAREVWDTALKDTPQDKRLLETIERLSR